MSRCVNLMPLTGAGCLVATGRPTLPFPAHLRLDLDSFLAESKLRIGRVSWAVSQRNIPVLAGLVSPDCLNNLRQNVFQELAAADISRMAILPEDIFFQFVDSAVQQDGVMRIKVVSYSVDKLRQSRTNRDSYKAFKMELHDKAARTQGILQKHDMNVKVFRELQDSFEALNPEKLMREKDILITNYTFQRNSEAAAGWKITEVCHVCSSEVWSVLRRLIWKGRLLISISENIEFSRVLRYEYICSSAFLTALVYLQVLAFVLGYKMEEEAERRRQLS